MNLSSTVNYLLEYYFYLKTSGFLLAMRINIKTLFLKTKITKKLKLKWLISNSKALKLKTFKLVPKKFATCKYDPESRVYQNLWSSSV